MKKTLLLFVLWATISCGVTKAPSNPSFQLLLLDEYVIPSKTIYQGEEIGGLSGIDFHNDTLVLIDDRSNKPIVYTTLLKTSNRKIDTLVFLKSLNLKKSSNQFEDKTLDLESIRLGNTNEFWLSSEGNINRGKNPSIFSIDKSGRLLKEAELPDYFNVNGTNQPKHNAVFEGMTWDAKKEKLWVATELPLQNDGKQPQLWRTFSPIRFTQYNPKTGSAESQFIYLLDRVVRIPFLPFYLNGVTEILSINNHEFLVLERGYSAGRGKHANRVKLFLANNSNTTNTLDVDPIKKEKQLQTAKKELVLDFKKIRKQLPSKRIDNIEGITFGPTLTNGNATLLFVSDNNFNVYGEQVTQFIWMEISNEK